MVYYVRKKRIGSVREHNRRSVENRETVCDWVNNSDILDLGVGDDTRRGAAVTLLKVVDRDLPEDDIRNRVIVKSKQLLGFEGITHVNGEHEKGLDVARHINAYPGTPGDYRAWIGGTRNRSDIIALLENINYGYHRARIAVMEELLAEQGVNIDESYRQTAEADSDLERNLMNVADDGESVSELRRMSEQMAAFWGAMATIENNDRHLEIIQRYSAELIENIERYQGKLDSLGISTKSETEK